MKKIFKIRIFFVLFLSFLLVNFLSPKDDELTPKILAQRLINFLPKKIISLIHEQKKTPPISNVVLSKEKLVKMKLSYNNEEFEVYVDPDIELTQNKIKLLYSYWKLVNNK